MGNTFTQIHIQTVFAVHSRECLIKSSWKDELYKYITGVIEKNNHKLLAIDGMPDHLHVLFGFRPSQSLSSLMQDVKGSSSLWINQKQFTKAKFSWQEGYGAFSYSKNDLSRVIGYIRNQREHHKKKSFVEEYRDMLIEFGVQYNERYLFTPIDYDMTNDTW